MGNKNYEKKNNFKSNKKPIVIKCKNIKIFILYYNLNETSKRLKYRTCRKSSLSTCLLLFYQNYLLILYLITTSSI